MGGFTINIDWGYFLAIMGALIGVAWYSSARFTALETSMKWIKETINDLKTTIDNQSDPAFSSHSPVNLNERGKKWLVESGIKEYLDLHKSALMKICEEKKGTNPYEVQKHIFKTFDTLEFELNFEDKLKKFAFEEGTTMNIMRRVAAIYFRTLCLNEFGMNIEDIDKHDPDKS